MVVLGSQPLLYVLGRDSIGDDIMRRLDVERLLYLCVWGIVEMQQDERWNEKRDR